MNMRILLCLLAALLLSACASSPRGGYYGDRYGERYYDDRPTYASCYDCGVVQRIETFYGDDRTSGAGAVLGGVIGGALGNQVGSGSGRTAATVAGALAGGAAGHAIERDRAERPIYAVHVELDNGRQVVVEQRELNGIRPGARVRIDDGRARLY